MEGGILRPLGVSEIVDTAINLCFRNFWTFAKIAAVIAIPMGAITFGLDQIAFADRGSPADAVVFVGEYEQRVDFSTFTAISAIEGVVALLAFLLVIGASFRSIGEVYIGREASSSGSIRRIAGRAHSLLWIGVLFLLGVIGGLLAFIVPGIWLMVAWSLAIPALVAENRVGTNALGRSFALVKDHWWRTFGAFLIGLVFIGLVQILLGFCAASLTELTEDSRTLSLLIVDSMDVLALIVTGPFQAAIIALIYLRPASPKGSSRHHPSRSGDRRTRRGSAAARRSAPGFALAAASAAPDRIGVVKCRTGRA